jgi:hypothetical protein
MSSASDDLGILIRDVSHGINNSLQTMLPTLELLLDRQDLPEAVVSKLQLINAEAHKIREYIARASFIHKPSV